MVLSFVIPAYDEELMIARTIKGIKQHVRGHSYEIIVVDNGSTDATASVASELGATVIHQPGGTIGALRNTGVRSARGSILVFLDADVVLTSAWATQFPASLNALREDPTILTGSLCSVPADASWLERWWFAPRTGSSHLGTGHMIVTRTFFDALGGFDERLETGEDYDLSRRALDQGGRISLDERLKVEHLGFPRTIRDFLKREAWHGVGDYRSVSAFLESKVAIAATVFTLLHAVLLVCLIIGARASALGAGLSVVALCLLSSYHKYRKQGLLLILVNAAVYWLYYVGRTLAIARRFAGTYSRGSR